jgi:hypothetical protein
VVHSSSAGKDAPIAEEALVAEPPAHSAAPSSSHCPKLGKRPHGTEMSLSTLLSFINDLTAPRGPRRSSVAPTGLTGTSSSLALTRPTRLTVPIALSPAASIFSFAAPSPTPTGFAGTGSLSAPTRPTRPMASTAFSSAALPFVPTGLTGTNSRFAFTRPAHSRMPLASGPAFTRACLPSPEGRAADGSPYS